MKIFVGDAGRGDTSHYEKGKVLKAGLRHLSTASLNMIESEKNKKCKGSNNNNMDYEKYIFRNTGIQEALELNKRHDVE